MSQVLRYLSKNKVLHLLIGIFAVSAGLAEVADTIMEDIVNFNLRGYHGLVGLGFWHCLTCLPDILDGIDNWQEGIK
jgi:hypothetical protein